MKRFKISVNGKAYEVEVGDLSESPISVLVDGKAYKVELESKVPSPKPTMRAKETESQTAQVIKPKPEVKRAAGTKGEVTAPMPGQILRINVQAGDRVDHRDVLCTLEAMKMENSIMSPGEGIVREVGVTVGQDVSYGDVLFVIG